MIIEIEGIDGVGKTTQCNLLKNYLEDLGRRVLVVKDLDSTLRGREIRKILNDEAISHEEELFLFSVCKSRLFSEIIIPHISKEGIIICDRGVGSFISYFESFGFSRVSLSGVAHLATSGILPHVTILIDLNIEEAAKRKTQKLEQSKFDLMSNAFFERQRNIFLQLAQDLSWVSLDGNQGINEIHQIIISIVKRFLH